VRRRSGSSNQEKITPFFRCNSPVIRVYDHAGNYLRGTTPTTLSFSNIRSRCGDRPTLDASPNENRVIFLSPLSKSAVQISLKKCEKSLDIFLRSWVKGRPAPKIYFCDGKKSGFKQGQHQNEKAN